MKENEKEIYCDYCGKSIKDEELIQYTNYDKAAGTFKRGYHELSGEDLLKETNSKKERNIYLHKKCLQDKKAIKVKRDHNEWVLVFLAFIVVILIIVFI